MVACQLEGHVRKMIIVSTYGRPFLFRQGSTFSKIFILLSFGLLNERFKLRILPHRSQPLVGFIMLPSGNQRADKEKSNVDIVTGMLIRKLNYKRAQFLKITRFEKKSSIRNL